jgi:two-component system, OmpR family, alkaline phosphatase synthesis response regulator PhoP
VSSVSRRILLVEDEESLVTTLTDRLSSEGHRVEVARDGDEAVHRGTSEMFDLVILDVALPRKSGFDVCRDLRQKGIEIPILMLTARAQIVDKVLGLKLGADDYLTKPFDMMELTARVEALLRRGKAPLASSARSYAFGDVHVDFGAATVERNGVPVEVSGLELKILRYLIEHRGLLVTRDELLENVWGYRAIPYTRTVDVHIASLRQKVEQNPSRPQFIVTVHGMGYKFTG